MFFHASFWHELSAPARIAFALALFGTATSGISFLLALLGGVKFRKGTDGPTPYLPPVSILKPVHGMENQQRENLRSFFTQNYAEYEILFCARSLQDPAILCAQELAAEYPHIPVRFLASGFPVWTNPKVFSMNILATEAKHETIVFCDSDIRVDPNYVRQIVQPLADPKVGLVTCAFRGMPGANLASLLIALNQTVEFSSGVVTANFLEDIRFALGSTLLTTKSVLAKIGGLATIQDVYADDFSLGNAISDQGYRVVLSHYVVNHFIFYKTVAAGLHHQITWMKSTRRSRPAGHFGVCLTYCTPFGLLGLLTGLVTGHAAAGLTLLLIACLNRWLGALLIGYGVMRDRTSLRFFWLYPLIDLLGFYCWFISNFGDTFTYRGEPYRFRRDGRIVRATEN
jgi:ceramide glucosyltransferase